jgi:uncharacterized protein
VARVVLVSRPMDEGLRVSDDIAGSRLEARVGDELVGIVEYRLGTGWIALLHTEVLPAMEGRGVGSRMAAAAIADARKRGLRVIVRCPFIGAWLERHPDQAEGIEFAGSRGSPGSAPRED